MSKYWIGVDLDGTLAYYEPGYAREGKIGDPIPQMVERIFNWLTSGENVKIFTARVYQDPNAVKLIKDWLKNNNLPDLEVTNIKDHYMTELWDDRCITVEKNTGKVLTMSK